MGRSSVTSGRCRCEAHSHIPVATAKQAMPAAIVPATIGEDSAAVAPSAANTTPATHKRPVVRLLPSHPDNRS